MGGGGGLVLMLTESHTEHITDCKQNVPYHDTCVLNGKACKSHAVVTFHVMITMQ